MLLKFFARIYNCGLNAYFSRKEIHHIFYTFHTIHLQIVYNGGFTRIFCWEYKAFETFGPGLNSNWQSTFYGLHGSVKRKLTHNDILINVRHFVLARGTEYSQSNG